MNRSSPLIRASTLNSRRTGWSLRSLALSPITAFVAYGYRPSLSGGTWGKGKGEGEGQPGGRFSRLPFPLCPFRFLRPDRANRANQSLHDRQTVRRNPLRWPSPSNGHGRGGRREG